MSTTYATAPSVPTRHPAPAHLSRTRLFGWSAVMMATWPAATVLFCVWVTFASLSLLTVVVPVLLALTPLVRRYVNAHRRWAERLTGEPIPAPYRPATGTVFARARTILLDPASWRDQVWLLAHSTVGAILSTLSFSLLAGTVFYAIYPFLYWVTDDAFRQPFGLFTLHTVGQSALLMPLALACFALWYATVRPLMLAQARMARALLR